MGDVTPKLKSSPSNSAGPTPTIMMERGREAACVGKTNSQFGVFALEHEDKRCAHKQQCIGNENCLAKSVIFLKIGGCRADRIAQMSEVGGKVFVQTLLLKPDQWKEKLQVLLKRHRDFLGRTLASQDTAS